MNYIDLNANELINKLDTSLKIRHTSMFRHYLYRETLILICFLAIFYYSKLIETSLILSRKKNNDCPPALVTISVICEHRKF